MAKDKKIALCAKNPKCPQQQEDIPIVEKLQQRITPCDGPNPKPQSCNPQLTKPKPHFGGLLAGLIAAVFFHIVGDAICDILSDGACFAETAISLSIDLGDLIWKIDNRG